MTVMSRDATNKTPPEGPGPADCPDLGGLPEVRLRLEALHLEAGPCCTSFGDAPEALVASIRRVGLLNPPLVHEDGEGGWEVVTGFRRLRALRALGCSSCRGRDLSGTPRSGLERLLLGLHDNLATRPLGEMDKGMALSRLSAFVDRDTLRTDYMPLLGLPRRDGLLAAYLALEQAEPAVRAAVAAGRLGMRAFQALQAWTVEDRAAAVQYIRKLRINFNKQNQFIDILFDLMLIEESNAQDILESPPVRALLEQGGTNPPQAAARLLEWLRRRRFPAVSAAERAFQRRVEGLGLARNVRVIPPPGFEGPVFRLEVAFRSGAELRDELVRLAGTPGIDSLGPPWEEDA